MGGRAPLCRSGVRSLGTLLLRHPRRALRRAMWGIVLGRGELFLSVNGALEWGVGVATFLSVLSAVPRHCACLTCFSHPNQCGAKYPTPPGRAQEASPSGTSTPLHPPSDLSLTEIEYRDWPLRGWRIASHCTLCIATQRTVLPGACHTARVARNPKD